MNKVEFECIGGSRDGYVFSNYLAETMIFDTYIPERKGFLREEYEVELVDGKYKCNFRRELLNEY